MVIECLLQNKGHATLFLTKGCNNIQPIALQFSAQNNERFFCNMRSQMFRETVSGDENRDTTVEK